MCSLSLVVAVAADMCSRTLADISKQEEAADYDWGRAGGSRLLLLECNLEIKSKGGRRQFGNVWGTINVIVCTPHTITSVKVHFSCHGCEKLSEA